jgi:hypothetical protein
MSSLIFAEYFVVIFEDIVIQRRATLRHSTIHRPIGESLQKDMGDWWYRHLHCPSFPRRWKYRRTLERLP